MSVGLEGRHARGAWSLFLAAALLSAAPSGLRAQSTCGAGSNVPTGTQAYHILGHEQHVWDMLARVAAGENSPLTEDGMNSVVSAVVSADNQVLYYDHWEDGFEADPFNPAQPLSLVLGDGDLTNGRACDWTTDPRIAPCDGTGDDILFVGTAITLNSNQGLTGACDPGVVPGAVTCTVPVNQPGRNPAHVRFDGGDLLVTSGGPIALIHSQDPLNPFIGGAIEMVSRQAVAGAFAYTVPVGEDLYLGNNTITEIFQYVDLNIVAYDDGTQVFVDSPGAGTRSFTLDQGQHYSSRGFIDGTPEPGGPLTINSGTTVSTTAPISGAFITGGDDTYSTDFFTLLPDLLHSTDYLIVAPGDDDATNGDRELNLYLFNPNPVNSVTVTATDSVGTTSINIPPASEVDYFTATGRFVPASAAPTAPGPRLSTVRLTSDRNFWGVAAHDHQTVISDWGYSWLATRFLTSAYTVSYAPGRRDPTGGPGCTGPRDSTNKAPVWIAATQDDTQVKIDLDNDGTFDLVDTNSDDVLDPGTFTDSSCAGGQNCIYLVDSLQTLPVYDCSDYDNTGTRIVASRPVGVVYGQDTEQAVSGEDVVDTGYVIYPINQAFLDPVLILDKTADRTSIPGSGGQVTYTLTVRGGGSSGLGSLTVRDLLPAGVPGTAYLAGSTLVTFPDLSQSNADPAVTVDGATGRARLDWALSPDTIGANQTLTIRYSVALPAGPVATLVNNGFADAVLGGSIFSPTACESVVRTDVSIQKAVADDGTPEVGEALTYSLTVQNLGLAAETGVVITDPVPAFTTFVPGSIVDAGPFTGTYSAAQNAVVWTAANFAAGAGPFTLTFQAAINPGSPAGTTVANVAGYRSSQTPLFDTNLVATQVVGASLTAAKSAPAVLHPGEVFTFEIRIQNTGTAPADDVLLRDPYPSRASYVPGTMEFQVNSGPFVPLTDTDGDEMPPNSYEGRALLDRLELQLASLAPGATLTFRFQARVTGIGGQFVNNQATVSSEEVDPFATNLVQVPIVGDAVVNGRVFLDLDGNGSQGAGEPGLADVDVIVTDSQGNVFRVTTNANGDYTFTVPAGSTDLEVDRTDPDFPDGAVLTTANDPRTVNLPASSTTNLTAVGFDPPNLTITKDSDPPGHEVAPGERITYTVEVTNTSGVVQGSLALGDPLPPGVSFVSGTLTAPSGLSALRVTEYFLPVGAFGGTTYTLTLNQNLAVDYFVILQGSAGDGGTATDRGPDADYARLTGDPFGSGDLTDLVPNNQLTFARDDPDDDWVGVVSVVECLGSCDTAGFRLLDVQEVAHGGGAPSGTDNSAVPWTDVNRVMLVGGYNGAGCLTTDTTDVDHEVCQARFYPSGADAINWTREAGLALTASTSTVMAVQWGSQWTVQHVRVTGSNGGGGLNAAGEYNTAALPVAVPRDNTWVWATGHTGFDTQGRSGESTVVTLGDGATQNAIEDRVAVGTETNNTPVDFEVWTLTHPSLRVDHVFEPDTDADGGDGDDLTEDVTVDAATTNRMALAYNSLENSGGGDGTDNFPRPLFSARYFNDTTVRLERRRDGTNDATGGFTAWVQGIDFSRLRQVTTTAVSDPIDLTGLSLQPGESLFLTFQVDVDDPLAGAITQIVNTATVSNPGNSESDSVTDEVIRMSVVVEYDNAGFAVPGASLTFSHVVRNIGGRPDSYTVTGLSDLGWRVDLLDPTTGALIATDGNGDGAWDGGVTVNTGTLAPGGTAEYQLRVWVPGSAGLGTQQTARLRARSDRQTSVFEDGVDEVRVVGNADLGPVILVPDNSGVVVAGDYTVYTHRVFNNTGATDTFDLQADSSQAAACGTPPCWTATLHYDSNGDGAYTLGVDLQIASTPQLASGSGFTFFAVVSAPAGTPGGTVDVTHLTATSRNDTDVFDGATDTTTIAVDGLDLSGGGTALVTPGATSVFPGTLGNLGNVTDTFDFSVTPSSILGLDPLLHGTELWIDTNGDDVPDLQIAVDADGDGTWDTVLGGYDTNSDGRPDVALDPGEELAYELRRPTDPALTIPREFVTVTAASTFGSSEDSITATNLLPAATRATIRGLRVDPAGVVAFATGRERGTYGFVLYASASPRSGAPRRRLNAEPLLSPVRQSMAPVSYRLEAGPIPEGFLWIEEIEVGGATRLMGPFPAGDRALSRALSRVDARLDRAGVPRSATRALSPRQARRLSAPLPGARGPRRGTTRSGPRPPASGSGVVVEVGGPGTVTATLADLRAQGLPRVPASRLQVSSLGQPVAFEHVGGALRFEAQGLSTDYTSRRSYLVTVGPPPFGLRVPLTRSSHPETPGAVRIERSWVYLPDAPLGTDPWLWDALWADFGTWPYGWWDPAAGDFDLPGLQPGLSGPVAVRVRLTGTSAAHEHQVQARVNGQAVGSVTFQGRGTAVLAGTVPAEALLAGGNQLSLDYVAVSGDPEVPDSAGTIALDSLEVDVPTSPPGDTPVLALRPYQPGVPGFRGVEYLVVTHPRFLSAAERIAGLKAAEGYATRVVTTTAAYDRFSTGVPEASAIRALVQQAAAASRRLRYLLLVGDDTFDTHDALETGAESLVPSLLAWDGKFGRVPSENLYADLDGDLRPDLAIGRLPVQTEEQAEAFADKIADQAQALSGYTSQHLFAVDNHGELDAPFVSEAQAVAAGLPPGSSVTLADVGEGVAVARAALQGRWAAGAAFTHYFGHGGVDLWGDESLLTADDVPALEIRPTVLLAWACESQWFLNLWGPAVNEALVLKPAGGALASFGPVGISDPALQKALYTETYRQLREPGLTLGEAIRRAKAAVAADPATQPVVDGFVLLGDPALPLP